mgnify:CR=1 FL=1
MTSSPHLISRDNLAKGMIQQMVVDRDGQGADILSEEELLASRRSLIPDDYEGEVWLFGYGSLIWNPVLEIAERRIGRIYGYHRRYCLLTKIGRGTPDNPGLILGLDHGGSCVGQALKICHKANLADELDLLWKREMLNRSYLPKKVLMHGEDGRKIEAITFVMNHQSPSYVCDLSLDEKARIIAKAEGFIGTSYDYLDLTLNSLNELGIKDQYLNKIMKKIVQLSDKSAD